MRRKGFTLVELAIVLVIIGIILAAVLKGQELIKNAKEKNFIQKLKFLAAAQYTYYDRHGHFAGDTNNDGLIDSDSAAWGNLTAEGILNENDKYHVFNGNFTFGGGVSPYSNYNYIKAIRVPAWVAKSFDERVDDGKPNDGNVRWGNSTTGDSSYPSDINGASNLYWWFDR